MGQLNFARNIDNLGIDFIQINDATLTFVPFNLEESLSLNNFNIVFTGGAATHTLSFGLYSLNGSSLSIINSGSVTNNVVSYRKFFSISTMSATQNITPGTWYFGVIVRAGAAASLIGQSILNASNAFLGSFIGGAMTESTAALPSVVATSDLNTAGSGALSVPLIILTA